MQQGGRIYCRHNTLESRLVGKYPFSRDHPTFPFCHVSYCQISASLQDYQLQSTSQPTKIGRTGFAMASWKETSPGRFEQPLDSIERFLLALARGSLALNREHWSVSIFARFEMKASPQDTELALRHAWKTMRCDHPQLACVVYEETKIYEVPDSTALKIWLDETFIIAPASATKQELLASFRPSARATLHFLPSTSEIIIHSSHWRIDFVGALSLVQNFFSAIAEPREVQFGDEGRNLSPSRDKAANYSILDDSRSPALVKEREKAAADLVMQLLSNLPSIGLPMQNSNQTPGSTHRSEVVLGPGPTSIIVSTSKKRGLTVTTALHAALVVALQQVTPVPPSSSSKYTSWGVFNVRPLLKAPFNDPSIHPVAAHIVGLPLALHTSTYANLALQLKQFYKQHLPPSADSHIRDDVLVSFTSQMADIAGQSSPVDVPAPSEPVLSSIGVVDGYLKSKYGEIEVKDFWLGVETTTPQIVCYLWTWQGKMTLSACYNETFYDEPFVLGFLERVIKILFTELAIQIA